jgi:hypothetical protein
VAPLGPSGAIVLMPSDGLMVVVDLALSSAIAAGESHRSSPDAPSVA